MGRLRQQARRQGVESAPADRARPQQFNTPHGIAISNDGIVYVADRANNRVQSFRLDGTFLKEGFIRRESQGTGTAFGVALSGDPQQRFLYVADGSNERVAILDRDSLEEIGQIGGPGRKAGEFFHIHSLASTRRAISSPANRRAIACRNSFTKGSNKPHGARCTGPVKPWASPAA